MKIVVDCYGGDHPSEIIKGCIDAVNEKSELSLVLSGDEKKINSVLAELKFNKSQIEILHAPETITNDDVPTSAIKSKKESSLVKALDAVKNREDIVGMVSCGSSGAVLSGGVLKVGRIKSVLRPALAPLLPTLTGGNVCLVDCGANVDCKPEYLVHFALMGSSYMRAVYGIESPRVALVSVGVEDKKGNELTKATFAMLKQLPINFVGNMEARDALSGDYDVLVCDGFVGNVLLKTAEGTASMAMKLLKESIMASLSAKIGALLMKPALKKMKGRMDYNKLGGAPFLGIEKIIVKGHGSSKAVAIKATIFQVIKMAEGNLVARIKSELESLDKLQAQAQEKLRAESEVSGAIQPSKGSQE